MRMWAVPERALRRLLSAHHARADELPALVMKVAPRLGATAVLIHVVDYRQSVLVRLTEPGEANVEPVPIEGTLAGRAFTTVSAQQGDGRLWLPLLNSTERLGVLEVVTGYRWERVEIVFAYRVSSGSAALTSEILELRSFEPDALPEVRADQRGLIERHATAAIGWAQRR